MISFPCVLLSPVHIKDGSLWKKKKYTEWNSGWALVISDSNKTMSEKGFFVAFYFFLFFSELQLRGGKWEDNVPPNAWLTVTGPGSVSTAEVVLFGEHCFHFRRKKKKKRKWVIPEGKGLNACSSSTMKRLLLSKGVALFWPFWETLKYIQNFNMHRKQIGFFSCNVLFADWLVKYYCLEVLIILINPCFC